MSDWHRTIKHGMLTFPASEAAHLCNCVGPQNGQPRCPCAMRGLIQRNGRWIQPEQDLGPVTPESESE